jgi:transcriptional regulator with XRE-family HTH domain
MDQFALRLRQRAKELGISHAEAARRSGLSERRYAHYVSGIREPDLATLVRIATALETTPDSLLGVTAKKAEPSRRALLRDRLSSVARGLGERDLEIVVVQTEALMSLRRKSASSG